MSTVTRVAAWIAVIALIVLTVVPPPLRPETGVPHAFEHFASFLLAGVLWSIAYVNRLVLWLAVAIAFTGGLELLQLLVPGRHARLSDFVVDALGACTGILISSVVLRAGSLSQA